MKVKTKDFEMSVSEGKLSEAEMIEMIIQGKTQYVPILFKPYEGRAKAIAKQFLRYDEGRIEDVLQESMMKTYQNLRKLRDRSKFGSWFLTIVRNQAIDFVKNENQYFRCLSVDSDWDINNWIANTADEAVMPDERISKTDILSHVLDQLEVLDHNYGDPLKMRYIEERSYEEISKQLNKPLGTVKSLIHRGKALLKDRLYAEISTA